MALHAFKGEEVAAGRLAKVLGADLAFIETRRFPDGETLTRVPKPAPRTIVYRSLDNPNEKLIELILCAEAWRREGARRLELVAPYLAYMRQDKAFHAGESVSQRSIVPLLARLFDRIVTVDAHFHRTPSFAQLLPGYDAHNLHAAPLWARTLRERALDRDTILMGPDSEAIAWVKPIAEELGLAHAVFAKQRHSDTQVSLSLPACLALSGRSVCLIDDVSSSGGTLLEAVRHLKAEAASRITILVTHALFSPAIEAALKQAGVHEILSSDSVPHPTNAVHLAPLLATALG
ncbi:MAG: ribose-phosphate diphosphokinase [Alphaproteobacteria bacterium]|nr:ribose-phosphate diphosphokinase [Alphaproteobacteria bacterium]